MFDKKSEEKRYQRYKYVQYRNLVVKALLAFFAGAFCAFLYELLL